MAFKLREATRVLLNASQQVRGRVLPLCSCYFHTNQQQDLLQLPNNVNKVYCFRNISSDKDPSDIKQVERNITSDRFHSAEDKMNAFLLNFNAHRTLKVISNLHVNGYDRTAKLNDDIVTYLLNSDENRAEEALTFLKGLVDKKIPIKPSSYNRLLQVLCKYNMHGQFFALVRFMEDHGIEADIGHQYQILQMAAKIGNSGIAQLCFDKVNASEEFPEKKDLYNLIISAYSKNGESHIHSESENAMVIHYYNEMIEKGYTPGDGICKLAMESYLCSGDTVRANQLAGKLGVLIEIRKDLMLNFNTFHAIEEISNLYNKGFCGTNSLIEMIMKDLINSKENRAEEALTFLKGLVRKQIPIKPHLYNRILQVLCKYNIHDQFFALVCFMEDNGIEADVYHQYQLLQMAAKIGNSGIAQLCFDKVNASEEFPEKKDLYNLIISAYSKDSESLIHSKESENAMVIHYYNEMIEKGYMPGDGICKLAMESYLRSGDTVHANQLAEKLGVLVEIRQDIMLNFNTFHAIEEISNLHNKGFCGTTTLIEMIMKDLINSKENRAEEALTFLKGLVGKKIPIKPHLYNRILQMEDNGIEADNRHHYQILKMTAEIGNIGIAQLCFDKLNDSEKFPEKKYLFYEIIRAYSKNGESQIESKESENALVVHYYNEMIVKGHKHISKEIKELAMKAYLRVGNFEDAIQVAEKHGVLAEIKTDLMFNFNALHAIDDVQQYQRILEKAAKTGNGSMAQSCFDKLIGCKEFPDKRYLYIILMKAYSKESLIEDSETKSGLVIDNYNKMITEGYDPGKSMNKLAIQSYLRLGDFDGANRVVEKWGQEKDALKHFLEFESAKLTIKCYLESGDIESANQVAENGAYKDGLRRFIKYVGMKVVIEGGN